MKHIESIRVLRLHDLNESVKFQIIDFDSMLIQYIAML